MKHKNRPFDFTVLICLFISADDGTTANANANDSVSSDSDRSLEVTTPDDVDDDTTRNANANANKIVRSAPVPLSEVPVLACQPEQLNSTTTETVTGDETSNPSFDKNVRQVMPVRRSERLETITERNADTKTNVIPGRRSQRLNTSVATEANADTNTKAVEKLPRLTRKYWTVPGELV
ncbi:uncharacterized protein LOC129568572 [Sitodiplosis mosellana]|uniref:uncharacterized protein LOC129568572 n=1 Tax=Sitodiplosis mosellana TaxID=263140 RepID=UPI002444A482|nr:uncharacterized protein LOC129568572 [Sitodiplosis mosellana]